MIKYVSSHVPAKVKRMTNKFSSILFQINSLSNRKYRLYFDDDHGILVDTTKNKILWIATNFSMAIFVVRLNKLLEFWKYEKTINKSEVDFIRYDYLKKHFKTLYYE